MKEKLKKLGYKAPKMEATSFKVEHGYAGSSVNSAGNTQLLNGDCPIINFAS